VQLQRYGAANRFLAAHQALRRRLHAVTHNFRALAPSFRSSRGGALPLLVSPYEEQHRKTDSLAPMPASPQSKPSACAHL